MNIVQTVRDMQIAQVAI